MCRRIFAFLLTFISFAFCLPAQDMEYGNIPDTLYGEVSMELEQIYGAHISDEYPLDTPAAARLALEEAAMLYSAMIYGWSFHYEIGEKARRIEEHIELESIASVPYGDPGLRVRETELKDMRLRLLTDYYLTDEQKRQMRVWRTGNTRNAQAIGYGPSGSIEEYPGWLALKKAALDDAARLALRNLLRGSERNRPKEVTGYISLASFPRYYIDGGLWAVSARFRVQITEIIPYAAY
jgi:hypothetical protein